MDAPTVAASRALGTIRAEAGEEFHNSAALEAGGRERGPLISETVP